MTETQIPIETLRAAMYMAHITHAQGESLASCGVAVCSKRLAALEEVEALVKALEAAGNRLAAEADMLERFLANPAQKWTTHDPRTKEPIVTSALGNLDLQPRALKVWAAEARTALSKFKEEKCMHLRRRSDLMAPPTISCIDCGTDLNEDERRELSRLYQKDKETLSR